MRSSRHDLIGCVRDRHQHMSMPSTLTCCPLLCWLSLCSCCCWKLKRRRPARALLLLPLRLCRHCQHTSGQQQQQQQDQGPLQTRSFAP